MHSRTQPGAGCSISCSFLLCDNAVFDSAGKASIADIPDHNRIPSVSKKVSSNFTGLTENTAFIVHTNKTVNGRNHKC